MHGPFVVKVDGIKICDPPLLDPRDAIVHADIHMRYNHTARQRVVDASMHLLRRPRRGDFEVRCALRGGYRACAVATEHARWLQSMRESARAPRAHGTAIHSQSDTFHTKVQNTFRFEACCSLNKRLGLNLRSLYWLSEIQWIGEG